MKCAFGYHILSRYADKDLPPEMTGMVESHIKECDSCRETLHDLLTAARIAKHVTRPAVSEHFAFNLERRLDEIDAGREKQPLFETIMWKLRMSPLTLTVARVPVLARAAVTAAALLMALVTGLYYGSTGSPSVTGIQGSALIMRSGTDRWQGVSMGTVVKAGDAIQLAENSQVNLSLPKKYSLRLKSSAEIKIAKLTPRYRKGQFQAELGKGDILVDVEEGFKGSKFDVTTDLARARALGTKFMVSVSDIAPGTWVGVVEGKVNVKAIGPLPDFPEEVRQVLVGPGMKTEVIPARPPAKPVPLLDDEWRQISELYSVGRKAKVALLVSTDKNRVLELLVPCTIFITDERPLTIPQDLIAAIDTIGLAVRTGDRDMHLSGINKLEGVVKKHPEADYNIQLMLYIGAYYYFLDMYDEAVKTFDEISRKYPGSSLASLAICAEAYIYEVSMGDPSRARDLYRQVLDRYPVSPDAEFSKDRLNSL